MLVLLPVRFLLSFLRCWARWNPDYLIWFCFHAIAYVHLWNYDPSPWKPPGCMITILQFSIWFCRMLLWYSPPPHPKSHHSTNFFFTQSIICWTEHPRLGMANGVMYSLMLGKAYFKHLKTGKLCQHLSHALLKSFWKLNPSRQILHQVGYIRSSGQNRWFGGGDTTVQTLVPTISLKIVLPKTL